MPQSATPPGSPDRPARQIVWDVANPFTAIFPVLAEDIDGFGHVNNRVYIRWQEQVSWQHSAYLGLTLEDYLEIGFGVVVRQNAVEYFAPTLMGDEVIAATWISGNDQRLRLTRSHQIARLSDGVTVFRGHTQYVCVDMKTGHPRRMPDIFKTAYKVPDK